MKFHYIIRGEEQEKSVRICYNLRNLRLNKPSAVKQTIRGKIIIRSENRNLFHLNNLRHLREIPLHHPQWNELFPALLSEQKKSITFVG